ncbi:hypothetical protein ACIU1J_10135 [Azospirillum doebereinerae]|uniref:hypothetical protein n=1 Tax=Azospirillum doebereinerae TaxID=92933 RepID=UPI001EE529C1|nr:hypothetical protein [Azospirillum doebereinerae]MCG5244144.1 hypothetical protein [Azospirillum doebereinerae]
MRDAMLVAFQYIGATTLVGIWLYLAFFSTVHLRRNHPSYVRTAWYFFSLAFYSTIMISVWAMQNGLIDRSGNTQGKEGEHLMTLLDFTMDINADFFYLSVIVSFIIVPQVISYLICAAFGCASQIVLFRRAMEFAFWSMMKTFCVVSGVFLSIMITGFIYGWIDYSTIMLIKVITISSMLISISLFLMLMYSNWDRAVSFISTRAPGLMNLFNSFHAWATRHSPPPSTSVHLSVGIAVDMP